MKAAEGILPEIPGRPSSRGSSCRPTFLRRTLQKLGADGARWDEVNNNGGDADPLNVKKGHTFWPSNEQTREDPWQHDRCYVTDRCYLKGILTQDLERYRMAFAEDLRGQLSAVQLAVQETDVGGLTQRFLDEVNLVRKREQETQQECTQLKTHLNELLRLNANLRQHELINELDKVKKHTQKLEDDAVAIHDQSTKIGESAQAVAASTGQISELVSALSGTRSLVETVGQNVVAEVRKIMQTEMKLLKGSVEDVKVQVKRIETNQADAQRSQKDRAQAIDIAIKGLHEIITQNIEESSSERAAMAEKLSENICNLSEGMSSDVAAPPSSQIDSKGTATIMAAITKQKLMLTQHKQVVLERMDQVFEKTCDSLTELHTSVTQDLPAMLSQQINNMETAEEADAKKLKAECESLKRKVEKLTRELQKERETNDPAGTLRKLLDIEERGNVEINFRTGDVEVKRDIPFDPKNQKEEPLGEFKDEEVAVEIINDLYEIWDIFKVKMMIEGHTKGGEDGFWQTLADNRAKLVVDTLESMGADRSKLTSKGLPGELGLNKVGVVIHLDIFPKRA